FLTVWGFSSDNWKRPDDQVNFLFEQAQAWIEKDAPWLHSRGVRLRHIGRKERLPLGLRQAMDKWGELTKENTGMTIIAAFDYGGRAEIIDAVRQIVEAGITPQIVDDDLFSRYLYTDGLPDVDLVIRTGGEMRLSNFMIWQAAYSEYYFTDVLWPDFDIKELVKALDDYKQRQRRFGGVRISRLGHQATILLPPYH
ncbi:unnamed protein product, partial [marine sediment metagenome]